MLLKTKALAITAFAAVVSFTSPATAATFNFVNITGNNATDAAIGEAQMTVDVDSGAGFCAGCILFTFNNSGPEASVIEATYWDDDAGILNAIASFVDRDENQLLGDPNVDFSPITGPGNNDLPGGNLVGFDTNPVAARADADNPAPTWGVSPGESLGVLFTAFGGQTFNDVIAAMNGGDLRIGIHVIAYDSGGSESFVSTGRCIQGSFECPDDVISTVPLPATLPLLLGGLLGAGFVARRRTRKSA